MDLDFRLETYEGKAFISDQDVEMVLLSGAYIKLGKYYHFKYKQHVMTITIDDKGLYNICAKRRVPCAEYELPLKDNYVEFRQRAAAVIEKDRLKKTWQPLDDGMYRIYAAC